MKSDRRLVKNTNHSLYVPTYGMEPMDSFIAKLSSLRDDGWTLIEFDVEDSPFSGPSLDVSVYRLETDEEMAARKAKQKKEAARHKQRRERSALKTREKELKEYERLKKKYENA